MTTTMWVALLRGINVGRNKRLAMADLQSLLESLGYCDVRTLLQSGNAIFTTSSGKGPALQRQIASQIRTDVGLDVKVLVHTAAEFAAVVDNNPFASRGVDSKQLHVAFLDGPPARNSVAWPDPTEVAPDEFVLGERAIYLRLPDGVIASRLPDWERLLGTDVTMRNWNTVNRVREAARG